MLILEMWHDFIMLTIFLLHFFNQGDVHESLLFSEAGTLVKVYRSITEIMARPFFKTSDLGCT